MRRIVWWKVRDECKLWLAAAFFFPVILGAIWITIAFLLGL